MSVSENSLKENLKISNIFETLKFRSKFAKTNKTYFDPDGLCCFVGGQGSGKTLSAVNYVYKLLDLYPKSKLVSNIQLKDYPIINFYEWLELYFPKYLTLNLDDLQNETKEKLFNDYLKINRVFPFNNVEDLTIYSNLDEGVIFLIDEIQLYLNSLESKSVPISVMNEISQQRKQRKHIVCTSQVFGRLAKPLREQFNSVIVCKNYLKILQVNQLIKQDDIDYTADSTTASGIVSSKFKWFHNPKYYNRYDTYYKIDRTKAIDNATDKGVLYE